MSKAERETIIRWDDDDRTPVLYTAGPAQARRWEKLGYAVRVAGTTQDGTPRSWEATGAAGCVRFRRVKDGAVVKRANRGQNLSVHRQILSRKAPAEAEDRPVGSRGGLPGAGAQGGPNRG